MAGRVLGDAIVVISPDASGFRTLADAQIRKALAGFRPTVTLGANAKNVDIAIAGIKARIAALSGKLTELRIGADTKQAEAVIARLQVKLIALTKQAATIAMKADTTKLDAAIAAEQAKLRGLQQQMSSLQMDADTKRAASKIADLQKQSAHLEAALEKMTADVDIKAAEAKLELIDAELRVLKSNAKAVKLAADTTAIQASITAVAANIAGLKREAQDIKLGANIDVSKLVAAEAALLDLEHSVGNLGKAVPVADTALGALTAGARGAGGWFGFLTTQVTLFGGIFNKILPVILTSVSVWHILADAIIEIGAVLIPASVAFGAFAFAATDAVKSVQIRLQAMHTELDATGRAIPGLTTGFEQLHQAVRPEVYQLFGDAIDIIQKKSGLFATVAKQTGTVVDQLAARFTYAVTSGKGVSVFFQNAVTDARLLGTLIGNLAGIFGNFLQVIPGFATHLLAIAVAFTHIIEVATAAAEPVERWVLLIHGWVLYTGLAVTATLAFVGAMANLAKMFFTFAAGQVVSGVNAIKAFFNIIKTGVVLVYDFVTAIAALVTEEGFLVAASELLGAVDPFVWVAAAVVALGALVIWMGRSKDAAQQFNDTMQQTIQNAKLADVVSTIQSAQAQTAAQLASANKNLNSTLKEQGPQITGVAGHFEQNYNPALDHAAQSVQELTSGQKQLNDQYQLVTGRIGGLSKEYGGNTQALGALNAAGITTSQLLDKNNVHWAQTLIQVEATTKAYQVMGVQAGQLGNDLDVLGRTATDQYQAIQKLNQAWGSFISDVTGTQTSLDSVLQGFTSLGQHGTTLTLTLGKLRTVLVDGKAAIDQLTPSGIALNQAFSDQVNNVEKLAESWRTAGLSNNLFRQGIAAAIAPLEKYAVGSQEATAQLVALAEQAGYQGPVSLQALNKFLGITSDQLKKTGIDTRTLKNITDQATQQEALLTGAMQAQGSYIANTLINDINQAILKYNGVEKAASAYGDAIARSGRDSDAAHAARQTLINDLIASGKAAGDTANQIAAMITKVLGIPPKAALEIVMQGTGSFSITQGTSGHAGGTPTGGGKGLAAGGYIQMGSGPTADDVPIMASKGEYVVKASSVAKYGRGAMDAINAGRYASGGLVQTGNTDVLTGQYAVTMYDAFRNTMTASMIAAMQAGIKSAEAAAAAAISNAGPGGGAGVQRWAGVVHNVLGQLGLPQGDAGTVLSQMATESGGNPTIVNKTDSNWLAGHPSVGLMQVIAGTFAAYGGPYRNTGPFEYGVSVNPTANTYAGVNYATHTYGNPGWLSVLGHGHGYGTGGLIGGPLPNSRLPGSYSPAWGWMQSLVASAPVTAASAGSITGADLGAVLDAGGLAAVLNIAAGFGANLGGTAGFGLTRQDLGLPAGTSSSSSSGGAGGSAGSSSAASAVSPGQVAAIAAYRKRLITGQGTELRAYHAFVRDYAAAFAHIKKGTWLYRNRKSVSDELQTMLKRQVAEQNAYRVLGGSGLTAANLKKFATKIREETRTAHDKGLTQGDPLADTAMLHGLAVIASIAGEKFPPSGASAAAAAIVNHGILAGRKGGSGSGAAVAGRTGRSGHAMGGVVMDRGGWLAPGWNPPIYNGTGRPEPVGPAIGGNEAILAELRRHNALMEQLISVNASAPARTGEHVAAAVSSAASSASFRARYPQGGW